jgi:hypothetical protein
MEGFEELSGDPMKLLLRLLLALLTVALVYRLGRLFAQTYFALASLVLPIPA